MSLSVDLLHGLAADVWARDALGFEPDGVQRAVLLSDARETVVNCTRQWGKTTTVSARALHSAIYEESLVLVLAPSARQSAELLGKVEGFASRLGLKVKGDGRNEYSAVVGRGRIIALPAAEKNIRGFGNAGLVIYEEASRIPDWVFHASGAFTAIGDGKRIYISTPFGKRGEFHRLWTEGIDVARYSVAAKDCPRISAGFLEAERRKLGDLWFRQEYCCEFVDIAEQMFASDRVDAALDDEVTPLWNF